MDRMKQEYQRMMQAIDKYEKGELKMMATYRVIRDAEKSLLELANNDRVQKSIIRLLIKTMRLKVREIKWNKVIG